MTYFTTWPSNGRPAYAEHDTEAQAEQHARDLVASGRATTAVVFEVGQMGVTA